MEDMEQIERIISGDICIHTDNAGNTQMSIFHVGTIPGLLKLQRLKRD